MQRTSRAGEGKGNFRFLQNCLFHPRLETLLGSTAPTSLFLFQPETPQPSVETYLDDPVTELPVPMPGTWNILVSGFPRQALTQCGSRQDFGGL